MRELALRVARGTIPGVPSLQVIRLCSSGAITVEGPVARDSQQVVRAAHLLEALLPGLDARTGKRGLGPLRLIVARALGTLDLPPYGSLEEFGDALSRFAAADSEHCVRELIANRLSRSPLRETCAEFPMVVSSGPWSDDNVITISDIRRARRATGLTLADISARIGLPVPLLCELEWGYLDNWPASLTVRRHIVSYARAAGLDDQLVVRTVWPLFEQSLYTRGFVPGPQTLMPPPIVVDAVPVDDDDVEGIVEWDEHNTVMIHPALAAHHSRRRSGIVAAFVIPALLAIAIAPAVWEPLARKDRTPVAPPPQHRQDASSRPGADLPVHAIDRDGHEPADRGVSDGPSLPAAFASAGSAAFDHAESNRETAVTRAGSRRSLLRITRVVDPQARNFHARPSPSGTLIAFDSDRDGQRGVYVADVDGGNVRRVSGEGFAALPSWSPDSSTLAFVRAEPRRPDVWNLWTVDLASGQTRRLTSHRAGQPWGGSWFPDGDRIAYGRGDRLVVRNLMTGTERGYPAPLKGRLVGAPAVSPDGRRILVQVARQGTWLLDLRKGTMRKVMADPSAEDYAWSPDGRRVAYHSRNEGKWGVWMMGPSNP